MIIYLHNGDFENFLTCVYYAFYRKEKNIKIYPSKYFKYNFVDEINSIETDNFLYIKAYNSIKKIGTLPLEKIYTAFKSETINISNDIYEYIKLGFKVQSNICNYIHLDFVNSIEKAFYSVNRECHLFTGFIRFKNISQDIYYSSIDPKFDILDLIAPHFVDRFSFQTFIIHDTKRNKSLFHKIEFG